MAMFIAGSVQRAVAPRIFCAAANGTNMTHILSGRVALCSPRLHLEFPVQLQLVPLWRKSGLHALSDLRSKIPVSYERGVTVGTVVQDPTAVNLYFVI